MARDQVSNSKLSDVQKQELRDFRKNNPSVEFVASGRVTLAIDWDNSMLGYSAASLTEKKFRRKVGEYYAMQRLKYSTEYFTEYHSKGNLFLRAYRTLGVNDGIILTNGESLE